MEAQIEELTTEQKNQLFNMSFKLRGDKIVELAGKIYIHSDLELSSGIEILHPEKLYICLKEWLEDGSTALMGNKL